MEEYFSTEDFAFACFLKAAGVDLRELEMSDPEKNKCRFVFRIKEHSDEYIELKREWDFSEKARAIKRALYANKILKKELKIFLTEYHKTRPHLEGGINRY